LFDTLEWANDLSGGLAETKTQQGRKVYEACLVYACIYKEKRKNRKSNYEERGDKQKKQDS